MLSIEQIIANYGDLMEKNNYTEAEKLQNIEVIRNALAYSLKERRVANSISYSSAKMLYPDIEEWNGIPTKSYLDLLLDSNIIPIDVRIRENRRKYLTCKVEGYCGDKFLELDITDDQYENDGNNDDAVQRTKLEWYMHCITIRNAVNAVELKSLKDEFGNLLIDYIGEEEYKSIETKYRDAMQLITYVG